MLCAAMCALCSQFSTIWGTAVSDPSGTYRRLSPIAKTFSLVNDLRYGSVLILFLLHDSRSSAALSERSELTVPALQIIVLVLCRMHWSPSLRSMKSGPTLQTPVFNITFTPILFRRFSALIESFSGNTGTIRSRRSTILMLTSPLSIPNLLQITSMYSASSPAISTPVKPAPTTYMLRSSFLSTGSGVRLACMKRLSM